MAWGAGIPAVRHIFWLGKIVLVDYSCRGQPRLETTACWPRCTRDEAVWYTVGSWTS